MAAGFGGFDQRSQAERQKAERDASTGGLVGSIAIGDDPSPAMQAYMQAIQSADVLTHELGKLRERLRFVLGPSDPNEGAKDANQVRPMRSGVVESFDNLREAQHQALLILGDIQRRLEV